MYDSLFSVTSDFKAVPEVCESFTVSESGLVYSFKIRDNIKFQNGKTLIPRDVSKSLNAVITSDGYYKKRLLAIESVAFSDTHVRIHLSRPVKNFFVLLDFPILYNGGEDEKDENILFSVPVGSGLYSVSEYLVNKEINLCINKSHYSGVMPYIENIKVHIVKDRKTSVSMFENGQIDMMTGDAADLENYTPVKNHSYNEYIGTDLVFVGMNTNYEKTYSANVRAFIANELSKHNFSDTQYSRIVSKEFKVGKSFYSDWEDSDNNGILDKTVDKEKHELSFELLVNKDNPKKTYLAQNIKNALIDSGINIKIRAYDFEKYKERILSFDYDLFLGETSLLPNFDEYDLSSITESSDLSEIPLASLYFKNEVLLCTSSVNAGEISTLNPYKSISMWDMLNMY